MSAARKKATTKRSAGRSLPSATDLSKTYAVGYGRPPVHSRFKPGQSGNPKGRPAGRLNVKTMVERVIHQRMPIRHGKKTRDVPLLQALVHAHAVKGAKGDARSAGVVLSFLPKAGLLPDQDQTDNSSSFSIRPDGKSRASSELFEKLDLGLLSEDDKIELSRLAEIVDLGGGITALNVDDFARARDIVNKGRGKDITPTQP
jgi:Family of unknown function (DUF5681)